MADEYSSKRLEWAKVVAVPLSLGLIAVLFNFWTGQREAAADAQALDSQYVSLALNLLSSPTTQNEVDEEQAQADKVLREWAVDLLAKTSPVEVTSELRGAFQSGSIVLPTPQLAPEFDGPIEVGNIDATFVRYRFRADTTTTYSAEVLEGARTVHNASGTATANQVIGVTANDLKAGTDYTITVTLDGSPSKTETTTIRTPADHTPDASEQVELLDLRITEPGSTRVQFNYESNVCANGSFTISDEQGNQVGSNSGQEDGCGTQHLAIPGFWTNPLQPDATYTISVTVEANGQGQGNDNTSTQSLTFTTEPT